MARHAERLGLVLVGAAAAQLALAGFAMAAEEPAQALSAFVGYLSNPVPASLPFHLTGEVDLGIQKLEGERDSPNFRTYRAIEEGFVANRFSLGLETKDQRRFIQFQGLDISKNDQNYGVSAGEYGRYRFDFSWDQIPHLYGTAKSPFVRSDGGLYTLPAGVARSSLGALQSIFNGSTVFDVKTRNDAGKAGFWWAPTPEWDIQLNYENVRRAGTRPFGGGFGDPDNPTGAGVSVLELPQPTQWHTNQMSATAGYSTSLFQIQGGYRVSFFHNDVPTMTYDNPLFGNIDPALVGTGITAVQQGRTVLAPNNQYHNLFLSAGVNLPMSTRIAGKFSYGLNYQDDTFYSHTITAPGALFPPANPAALQLYSPSLRGDVRTMLFNITGTSRPIRDVTVTASYRLLNRDNRTLVQTFPDTTFRDTVDNGFLEFARIYDYKKQNGDLDVAWRALRQVTLRAGFGWEQWDRPDTRDVGRSDEYSGKFGLTYHPFSWLDITGRYIRSWKRINDYQPFAALSHLFTPDVFAGQYPIAQSPLVRKFDEAARDRHKGELALRLRLFKGFSLGGSLAYAQDRYPFSPLGLQQDQNWSGSVHASYTPVEWLTLRANYTRQEDHAHLRSRSRPQDSVSGVVGEFADFEWVSKNVDTSDAVGAGLVMRIIPDRMDLQTNYSYQRAITRVNTFNPFTPTSFTSIGDAPSQIANASATSFPDDRMTLHRVSGALRYWLLKNLTLRFGYTYERFRVSYWQTDFIQPMNNPNIVTGLVQPGPVPDPTAAYDVFLGLKPFRSYEAHIIGAGITYGF